LEQRTRVAVDASEQYPLVAHIAKPELENFLGRLRYQRRDLVWVIDVRVQGQVDTGAPRLLSEALEGKEDLALEKVLRDPHQRLARQADIPDVPDIHQ